MKRIGFEEEQLLSVYRDYGVIPKASRDDNFNKPSDDLGLYQIVEPGDLVINKMKAWQGSVAISDFQGIVSPAYFVFKATHSEEPRYLHYLLRSAEYTAGYLSLSKGIRPNQWDLEPQEHSRMPVLIPPPAEQTAIATFLDRETGKIDVLVEEQRRLIDLIKEKRQSVISHAVTKGLNPDAPTRASGVEWLGEVPEHWEVRKFTHVVDVQEGPGILAVDFCDAGIPLMRVAGVQGRWATLDGCNWLDPAKVEQTWSHFRLESGDLVISASASMGTVSEVGAEAIGSVPYTGLIRLRPKHGETDRDYIRTAAGSSLFFTQIDQLKAGAIIQHFGPTHLARMVLTLPPVDEQAAIANYVDQQSDKFDSLIFEAEAAIALLTERRSALISAAVTGKIALGVTSETQTVAA
ncbi:restriction endonuclease subunit S [Mesorhizobium sp.]|uniref:restriction endonuclease subunit S n=1 Tax=Mesorhizobium sp. TaxID=1871066 RepID=UPI0011F51A31|nr:restriction endonuclease subunit S [Mesorhizobium sp.]TIL67580.1 MAG: restriction endonuclease subunit S [Mesorhizobium sp.]